MKTDQRIAHFSSFPVPLDVSSNGDEKPPIPCESRVFSNFRTVSAIFMVKAYPIKFPSYRIRHNFRNYERPNAKRTVNEDIRCNGTRILLQRFGQRIIQQCSSYQLHEKEYFIQKKNINSRRPTVRRHHEIQRYHTKDNY